MSIVHAVIRLRSRGTLSDDETIAIGAQVAALINIKSMTDPAPNIEDQVEKSIGKKLRVTDRPRPHALQLYTAFVKIMDYKKAPKGLSPTHCRQASCEQCCRSVSSSRRSRLVLLTTPMSPPFLSHRGLAANGRPPVLEIVGRHRF